MKNRYFSRTTPAVMAFDRPSRWRKPIGTPRIGLAQSVTVSFAALVAGCGSYTSNTLDPGGASATGGTQNGTAGTLSSGGGATAGTGNLPGGSGGTSSAGSGGSVQTATGGGGTDIPLPCAIMSAANSPCVSAHSTVRVIVPGYSGPLYQVCKGTTSAGPDSCKGMPLDIMAKDGYADSAAQEAFCGGSSCTITKIYDQSGQKNDLEPAPRGGNKPTPDNPAKASALKVSINGHTAYGVLIKDGIGYRAGCVSCTVKTGNGIPTGDQPESVYWVTSQKDLISGCCFDYGNAETTANDDSNGTMEAIYFGAGVIWGTGFGGKPGPWIMADLEDGLYAGWVSEGTNHDKDIPTNKPLKFDFVSGVLLGDTADKNGGKGRFALYGGDATAGAIQEMYDGIRPEKPGYVPMQKQGSIILGIGGDNSNGAGGRFYEAALGAGPVLSKAAVDALQAAIVAAKYAAPPPATP